MASPAAAQADPFADEVESFALPNIGCLSAGGTCDVTSDDADGGLDALGPDDGDSGDNTTFTTLGFDTVGPVGGVLVLNFTDNLCVDKDSADDFTVFELGVAEEYDVAIGLKGFALTTLAAGGLGTTDFDTEGIAFFSQIKLTATNDATPGFSGADIDAVKCLFDIGVEKAFAEHPDDLDDPDEINQTSSNGGFDAQQVKAFTITITNNTGVNGGLAGLTFEDTVPAEFDLDPDPDAQGDGGDKDGVEVTVNFADCTASGAEGGAKGKGKGNQKLAPEFITMTAGGLDDGESCTITVWVMTDDDHPGRGNNPDWTPTSCPVTLNDGVKIIDAGGNLLFQSEGLIFDNNDPVTEGVCNPA